MYMYNLYIYNNMYIQPVFRLCAEQGDRHIPKGKIFLQNVSFSFREYFGLSLNNGITL